MSKLSDEALERIGKDFERAWGLIIDGVDLIADREKMTEIYTNINMLLAEVNRLHEVEQLLMAVPVGNGPGESENDLDKDGNPLDSYQQGYYDGVWKKPDDPKRNVEMSYKAGFRDGSAHALLTGIFAQGMIKDGDGEDDGYCGECGDLRNESCRLGTCI